MYINDNEPYSLHWPMKGGSLNLHSGVGGSLTSVCADLEAIWAHGIKTYLNIPIASLQVCSHYMPYSLTQSTISYSTIRITLL